MRRTLTTDVPQWSSGVAATATCTDGRARVRTRVMAVLWDTWDTYVGYVYRYVDVAQLDRYTYPTYSRT